MGKRTRLGLAAVAAVLAVAAVAAITAIIAVPIAASNDGSVSLTQALKGARLPRAMTPQRMHGVTWRGVSAARKGKRGPRGPRGPQGPPGRGTTFFRGNASPSPVAAGQPSGTILECPAGFTGIAGGFTADSAAVTVNNITFDPSDPRAIKIGVSNFGNKDATWEAWGTCEK